MSAVPAFLRDVDHEELDQLAQLTGQLEQPVGDAELDAVASIALREMAEADAELARYEAAGLKEMERIAMRYAAFSEPHARRRAQAEEIVKECARRAHFVGKAKSRKVGNGTYGRKTVPEKVKITDPKAALHFALTDPDCPPEAVKEKIEQSVVHAVIAPIILAKVHQSGLLPNGFEHVSEHEEYFAKPIGAEGE